MLASPNSNEPHHQFPRRVSFDLSHNTVYLLPTLEQCRDAAKQRSREEWQRKTLNEDMLSEDIIVEIQEDCSAGSRDSEEEGESVHSEPVPTKSCLKKPPVVTATTSTLKKKNSSSKKNQKKRKRNHGATAASKQNVQNVISVH
ncbi:hypothetical protein MBANPS3_005494 [Mucor bainieri]